eukprot:3735932-Heterocapsa_arctica.AAC.1
MTKEEATEMITNCVRYQSFWIHATVYEEDEERGGKAQRLGYMFYRDYGNETYVDFLRTMASRARGSSTTNRTPT